MSSYTFADMVLRIVPVLLIIPSVVFHEMGHGFAAYKLGDPTAKLAGRLSANPLRHVDLFGSVILPLILAFSGAPVIGYAKPVPYDPRYFKNLKLGEVMVGLAGPFVNFLLACAGSLLCLVGTLLYTGSPTAGYVCYYLGYYFSWINLLLMFFNLIPFPPLDGSSIIAVFLPRKAMKAYYSVQRYAMIVLLLVLIVVPYAFNVDPVGAYLNATAGRLLDILIPW